MQLKQGAIYLIFCVIIVAMFCQSCVSHQELVALNAAQQEMEEGADSIIQIRESTTPERLIVYPNDLLVININTFEGNTAEFLQREFSSNNINNRNREYGPDALYYNSYKVDQDGHITLPLLDRVEVAGQTTSQIKTQLDSAYATFFKFASANVKLANMRVTVLGEVNTPGVQYFFNDQTSLLEAISMAGDFSDFANRKKVKLIRRSTQGSETVMLNMYEDDFIDSEFFYVKPNDIIYIEPIKAKAFDVTAETIGVVLSAISTAILLATFVLDISNDN